MDGAVQGGGIASLLEALETDEAFAQAVEYDLLNMGYRLRWVDNPAHDFTWWDVYICVAQAPQHSAVMRAVNTDHHSWGLSEQLSAATIDVLSAISWQLGNGKGQRPKPIPRPGVDGYVSSNSHAEEAPQGTQEAQDPWESEDGAGTFMGVPTPVDELNEWFTWSTPPPSRDEKIRTAYAAGGTTYRQLAEEFGVSPSTIGRIVRSQRT